VNELDNKKIIEEVSTYYSNKIKDNGQTAKGVDWNSIESQELRFEQLSKLFQNENNQIKILDYGCGFGAYYHYLEKKQLHFKYSGFDVSSEMIKNAKSYLKDKDVSLSTELDEKNIYDYIVASGLFNVKQSCSNTDWYRYILETLKHINMLSEKGFAFNILTKYSDKEYMKDYLYYADPLVLFDYCKLYFSKNVSLLHDYDLYEFTILVKK
jgi:cyclopropane fatty-acyl-phospholipid synthase-like methyltransferase